jgi:hypothetical protein
MMPYSDITGPISYFYVTMDGVALGRAYALEFVLDREFVENLAGKMVGCSITGVGFDGQTLASCSETLRIGSP